MPYLADRGFNSSRYAAWSPDDCRWLASKRHMVDTTFAILAQVFDFEHLDAHSRWGQYTRIAAKIAAYHIRRWFNRLLGRPEGALGTLIA